MDRFTPRQITAAEVRAYREETGASLHDAKKHFQLIEMRQAYANVRVKGTLEEKIEFLLDRFGETLDG